MKQSGFRLVQRKFAQGVPIPSSPAAPTPPEKKTDPPCPPRSVYHNNMSARSLLDIVALQNLHRHKQQPLVLLERLREDELPSLAKAPARKRRLLKTKMAEKNKMALRSGKRKSPDTPKIPGIAKPLRRKKNSSESTDDVPLAFYNKKRKEAQAKETLARRETRSRTEEATDKPRAERRKPDEVRTRAAIGSQEAVRRLNNFSSRLDSTEKSENSFTFKEPRNPARLSYRRFTEQRAAVAAAKGRQIKKIVRPTSEVRSSPRSSTCERSTSQEPGVAKRLRNKPVSADKPQSPAISENAITSPTEVEPSSLELPESNSAPAPPSESSNSYCDTLRLSTDSGRAQSVNISDCDTLRLSMDSSRAQSVDISDCDTLRLSMYSSRAQSVDISDCDTLRLSTDSNRAQSVNITDLDTPRCSDSSPSFGDVIFITAKETLKAELTSLTAESLVALASTVSNTSDWCVQQTEASLSMKSKSIIEINDVKKKTPPDCHSDDISARLKPDVVNPTIHEIESTSGNTDSEVETLNVVKEKINMEKRSDKGGKQKSNSAEPREVVEQRSGRGSNLRIIGRKNTQKRNERPAASKPDKRKVIKRNTKNMRDTISRVLREPTESRQAPANSSPDVYEFDAEREASRPPSGLRARRSQPTPPESQPTLGDTEEILAYFTSQKRREPIPNTSRESISDEKKKALIENLSSRPSLLDKFLNCLSPEVQSELDNLIAAEQASGEIKDMKSEYLDPKTGALMEALTFYPTEKEFTDPILYFEKIAPLASAHGLCKIVPPAGFKPPCNISDIIRFAVIHQYISKMYSRWGPVTRELAAIKAHLSTQGVVFARSPLLDGSEVNLPKLYHVVERHGGLNNVMQRKRWGRVADEMKLTKLQHPERKLDPIYMRYLLPYATLSDQERQAIMSEVEKYWTHKYQKMLKRARNPFQRQARMLSADTENESSDDERDDTSTAGALREAEDCTVPGRIMNLATFKKVATALMDAHFEPKSQSPNPIEVEKAYWRAVLLGTEHIVANTASIDTGEEGYGFPKDPGAEYGTHPWNLKVLARNPNNVLRYLGQVLGVTVPTLHLNMLFSTSCWHRDPHGLPWIEYMHSGAEKIWYGIPGNESANFRRAVETLCPAYCQNKSIWLASEITMIPPNILSEHEVRLSRLIQRPGEYVLVFPEAHSCSITTGYGISESVYFASNTWLSAVYKLFQELRNSCEPTMFSLEQLLLNGSKDDSAPSHICTVLSTLLCAELEHRRALERKGLEVQERPPSDAPLNTSYFRATHARDHDDECEYCRCTLYLSKVIGLTGRNSAVCPEHALRLLETKKHRNLDLSTLEFLSSYSTRTIEEMVERLETSSAEPVIDLTSPTPVPMDPQPGTSRHT